MTAPILISATPQEGYHKSRVPHPIRSLTADRVGYHEPNSPVTGRFE